MILSGDVEIIKVPLIKYSRCPTESLYALFHKDTLADYNIDLYWWRYYYRINTLNSDLFSSSMLSIKSGNTEDYENILYIFKDVILTLKNLVSTNCSVVPVPSSRQDKTSFVYDIIDKLVQSGELAMCPIYVHRIKTIKSAKSGNKNFECHYSSLSSGYNECSIYPSNLLILDDNYHTGTSMRATLEHVLETISEIDWNPNLTMFCLGKIIHEEELDTILEDSLSVQLCNHTPSIHDKLTYLQSNTKQLSITDEYNPPISRHNLFWTTSENLNSYTISARYMGIIHFTIADSLDKDHVYNKIDELWEKLSLSQMS